jgi:hypothetical protein
MHYQVPQHTITVAFETMIFFFHPTMTIPGHSIFAPTTLASTQCELAF